MLLFPSFRQQKFQHWHHFLPRSLLEESYVMKDPFTSDKGKFLILGSRCSVCSRLVCVGPVGRPRRLRLAPHTHDRGRGDVRGQCEPQPFLAMVT